MLKLLHSSSSSSSSSSSCCYRLPGAEVSLCFHRKKLVVTTSFLHIFHSHAPPPARLFTTVPVPGSPSSPSFLSYCF